MALHPLRQRTTEIDSHRHDRAAPSGEAFVPVQTTYPGVYIVEQKSGSHVITGVSTSVTAFVGAARKRPGDTPVALNSCFSSFFPAPAPLTKPRRPAPTRAPI